MDDGDFCPHCPVTPDGSCTTTVGPLTKLSQRTTRLPKDFDSTGVIPAGTRTDVEFNTTITVGGLTKNATVHLFRDDHFTPKGDRAHGKFHLSLDVGEDDAEKARKHLPKGRRFVEAWTRCPCCAASPVGRQAFQQLRPVLEAKGYPIAVAKGYGAGNGFFTFNTWSKPMTNFKNTGRVRYGHEVAIVEMRRTVQCPFHGLVKETTEEPYD